MTSPPRNPKIYHITHVKNLSSIVQSGGLWSDAVMLQRGGPVASIGMRTIKQMRLALPVKCHDGDNVGEYVPFYFCPRSIMLYLIHKANHAELTFREGQDSIVHLEAEFHEAVDWAEAKGRRWAFTLSNAGAAYSEFRNRRSEIGDVNWAAIRASDFRDPEAKEGKQAEFLLRELFPWELIHRVGVSSPAIQARAIRAMSGAAHQPPVEVRKDWYYS